MEDFLSTSSPAPEIAGHTPEHPQKPKGKPKSFSCPSCGGAVTIKAVGITISAVCNSCSSVIDVTNENYRIIEKANKKTRKTLLDIGSRGRLRGVDWEVVGYMGRTDGSGIYGWDEYLLYNPYHGFRFLVHSAGHWNIVKVLRQAVSGAGVTDEVWFDDKKFRVFLKGEALVDYVKGEFYWRVRKGERTDVADYIAPPYMLSVEKNDQEINASLGEYIEPDEVAEGFKIEDGMLRKEGVAPNQPSPYQGKSGKMWLVCVIAVAIAIGIQFLTITRSDNAGVYDTQNVYVMPSQKGQTFSSPSFNLPKDGNLLIRSSSPVDNNWLELDLSLVNELTNEEYETTQAIEYYHGYDGGESWSEGSQRTKTFISKVTAGNYRMLINADAGAFQRNTGAGFNIQVWRDVPNWSNFWITMLLLMVYPVFAAWRCRSFEIRRWSDSDYAPALYRQREGSDSDWGGDD